MPGAPIMALITIQPNGQVCLTGSPTLCQVLKGTKGQDILEVAEKSVNKAVVPGAKERGTYHQTQKPEYWPKEVPFCSHSAKGPDGKGRMISITQIKEVLECFRSYCAEKIQEGCQPINYVSTTTMDELQKLAGLEKGKHERRDSLITKR
ncbi:uncharacterized protein LOC132738490 [Ruditapes philippinarum]|uniref:uncharacterized protein LOC132738490 n=1 Tax=Ruditapes philippinarum TaxID=129788 RepID=UPI00295B92F2|nr:uncharacterized protein LOC132738490 [Ruditapes philippinarum]